LKDNKGNVVIPVGQDLKQQDIKLEEMNYLVEGVLGAISS
jgi:basic membrane protein A and related proteins